VIGWPRKGPGVRLRSGPRASAAVPITGRNARAAGAHLAVALEVLAHRFPGSGCPVPSPSQCTFEPTRHLSPRRHPQPFRGRTSFTSMSGWFPRCDWTTCWRRSGENRHRGRRTRRVAIQVDPRSGRTRPPPRPRGIPWCGTWPGHPAGVRRGGPAPGNRGEDARRPIGAEGGPRWSGPAGRHRPPAQRVLLAAEHPGRCPGAVAVDGRGDGDPEGSVSGRTYEGGFDGPGELQEAVREAGFDGGVSCDFHNRDALAYRILGMDGGKVHLPALVLLGPARGGGPL
jgi:hypothetical protein